MAAFLDLARRRDNRERCSQLVAGTLAARGDEAAIERQLSEWTRS